jgi:hypothetical protein
MSRAFQSLAVTGGAQLEKRASVCLVHLVAVNLFLKPLKIHSILQSVEIQANLIAIAGRTVLLKTSIFIGILRIHGIWVQ